MTATLVAIALVVACTDWFAVGTGNRALEHAAKPATMVPLIAVAATADVTVPAMRWWFVAALVFSLAGDVFLMLADERWFIFGLGSFFLGHVAYIGGFVQDDLILGAIAVGAVAIAVLGVPVAARVVRGARDNAPELAVPVVAYIGVISVMVLTAVGSLDTYAIVGALLFYASDSFIGWSRFVGDFPQSHLAIMMTYHLGQLLLVVSLLH